MSKLVIAAAGSGKTTYLVKQALKIKDANVLITTFTDANEASIINKIVELNGFIPSNIHVQTWFSFLLQHGVRPYQSFLYDGDVDGLILVNSKSAVKYYFQGNPVCFPESDIINHYFNKEMKIFSDKLSKFVCRCNTKCKGLVIDRMRRLYPYIFIDEVQDLAGYDLEIIQLLNKANVELLLVGDPRQVTYHTHDEAKYKKKYIAGEIASFITDYCPNMEIDENTLNTTYRNEKHICDFSNRLYPTMKACNAVIKQETGHNGIFIVKSENINKYIDEYHPMQLRDKVTVKVNENAEVMNFGASKGLTFERVLIYPTEPMLKWLKNQNSALKDQSKAKLYVAITRAIYSVAFVDSSKKGIKVDGAIKWE